MDKRVCLLQILASLLSGDCHKIIAMNQQPYVLPLVVEMPRRRRSSNDSGGYQGLSVVLAHRTSASSVPYIVFFSLKQTLGSLLRGSLVGNFLKTSRTASA